MLPATLLLLADGGYGNVAFMRLAEAIPCDKLCRLAKNRVLYATPLPRTEKPKPGHPEWHGAKFRLQGREYTVETKGGSSHSVTGAESDVKNYSAVGYARPSQPRGYSQGRQKGVKVTSATRYKTVYKAKNKTDAVV